MINVQTFIVLGYHKTQHLTIKQIKTTLHSLFLSQFFSCDDKCTRNKDATKPRPTANTVSVVGKYCVDAETEPITLQHLNQRFKSPCFY